MASKLLRNLATRNNTKVLRQLTSVREQHTTTSALDQDEFLDAKTPPFRNDFSQKACEARRIWAEKKSGKSLSSVGQWMEDFDTKTLKGNIEMPIGLVKVPVAVVGPLRVNGESAKGEYLAPFATTEGALTASIQRGVNAINAGSGAITFTGRQVCSRGPCFVTRNAAEAQMFGNWTKKQKDRLQEEVVRKVSKHAILDDIATVHDFEAVHLIILFNTGDACGQNMATVCTWHIMKWLMENIQREIPQVHIKHAWVESNSTTDKKPGAINVVHGRGISAKAEVILPENILNKYLNCTSEDYLDLVYYCSRVTYKATPFGGFNVNPANAIAALYLATGQDAACVADSILGATFEVFPHMGEGGGVIVKSTLPHLLIGTVGGGTALPTQSEGLDLMNCLGEGKIRRFAELVTAFTMALDISSSTAITAGKFATGHDKLGRNRPT